MTRLFEQYQRHVEFLGEDTIEGVHHRGAFDSQVLHLAAFRGSTTDVEAFIALGADINAIGDLGLTPLHYAVLGGHADTAALLMEHGARQDMPNEFGETPLQMAHLMGQQGIVTAFGNLGAFLIPGTDTDGTARQRWIDFRLIQQENFEACRFDE
jgi:ankyrin repeat protein